MGSIQSFISRAAKEGAFPGAVWMIGNGREILEQGTAGVLGEGLGPVQLDAIYDLASLTKIIVAIALMRQLEDGLISLEDTLSHFFPSCKNSPKEHITVFSLLTHTSPIPALSNLYRQCASRKELVGAILRGPARTDSPERVEYTCEGFILLGEILSIVDGEKLDAVLRRRVLEPLCMNDTYFNPPTSMMERIAPAEYCPWRGRLVRGQVHDENAVIMGGVSGNAGLFSTAADVAKAAGVFLDSHAREKPFLRQASIRLMTGNHTAGKGQNRGLGWMLAGPGSAAGDLMSPRSFGHTGFTGTSLWIDPVQGVYGVLLSNRIHPRRDNDRIFRVRRIFHNLMILQYGGKAEHKIR
jgi:CubicO group peptidase (beta-lactamase class C family)